MVSIKIECGCGQKYAFDVEPVERRMPHQVACPACGMDGTTAAEEILAQHLALPAVVAAAVPHAQAEGVAFTGQPAARVAAARVSAPGRATGRPEVDREKVAAETRSKVLWGDAPEEVLKFAMMQGLPRDDASELVEELMQERVAELRGIGTRKMVIGAALICVPVAAYLGFMHIGFLPIKLFGLTCMVGLYGGYQAFRGAFMVLMPRSEAGDIADK
jgi:hypothetical protein